jgi:hypothetical protein
MSSDLAYMVIYPRGDRSQLSVAQVYTWEYDEWDLASLQRFDERPEAEEYAEKLGRLHNLQSRPTQKLLD